MKSLPRIRTGLLRHPLDGQVLVHDSRYGHVHLLDPTTACVMELLEEGGWTAEGIAAELSSRLNVAATPGFLPLALDELRNAGLLDETATMPEPLVDVSRRELLRKLTLAGVATVLLPAVATLTATKGYAQGTLLVNGAACGGNAQCASNFCCAGTCQAGPTVGNCGACSATCQCTGGATCGTGGSCSTNATASSKDPNGTSCTGGGSCCSGNCTGAVGAKVCS
jgi:PqqD family protein of HPr-rel-A system